MKMPLLPVEAKQKKETETLSVLAHPAARSEIFPPHGIFFVCNVFLCISTL